MTTPNAPARLKPSDGEWFAEENEDSQGWRVLAANPPVAGSDDTVYFLIADDMTEADARLLVASRLLLAAAQHAIAACPRCGGSGEIDAAGPGERVRWAPCAACAELRAAVQAAEPSLSIPL